MDVVPKTPSTMVLPPRAESKANPGDRRTGRWKAIRCPETRAIPITPAPHNDVSHQIPFAWKLLSSCLQSTEADSSNWQTVMFEHQHWEEGQRVRTCVKKGSWVSVRSTDTNSDLQRKILQKLIFLLQNIYLIIHKHWAKRLKLIEQSTLKLNSIKGYYLESDIFALELCL